MEFLLGLGGNLGDPPSTFQEAIAALSDRHRLVAMSSMYRSKPVGPPQPEFYNLAALFEVRCHPVALLADCQHLETVAGRDRSTEEKWGARPLDIDLLMVHGFVRRGPLLELPHPHFAKRAFALVPAAEIAPDWRIPFDGRTIGEIASMLMERDPGAAWKVRK